MALVRSSGIFPPAVSEHDTTLKPVSLKSPSVTQNARSFDALDRFGTMLRVGDPTGASKQELPSPEDSECVLKGKMILQPSWDLNYPIWYVVPTGEYCFSTWIVTTLVSLPLPSAEFTRYL